MTTIALLPARIEESQVTTMAVCRTGHVSIGQLDSDSAMPAVILLTGLLVFLAMALLGRAVAPVIEVLKAAAAAITGALLLLGAMALLVTALVLSVA
jgi:hypothetical protein